uniref:hypothetical protein n=1 Tax=Amycolatopsis sp. CA-096443 TaxID=3239919 RepID=UPI003F492F69
MTSARWFGEILSWRRNDDGWETRHGGQLHEIVKLARRDADGQNTSPGWHLIHDQPGVAWCGPALGRTRDHALVMAEAHILVPYAQRFATGDAPGFIHAMTGAGPVWGRHRLTAKPDHEGRRFTAHRADGVVIGEIRPRFLVDGDPALEPVRIQWTPELDNGPRLDPEPTWHRAAAALAHAVNKLTALSS